MSSDLATVEHDGRETTYRVVRLDGDGPTTLYVHGSGASHRVWAGQYGPRGPTHPAVALDLSGHGDSDDVDTEPGPETLAAYADDLVAVADAVGAEMLIGNSLGGAVLLHALLERSIDPTGVVLAGTGAKLGVSSELRDLLETDFEAAVEFLHADGRLFADADERTRERSMDQMRTTDQRVTRRDFLTCDAFDVRDRLDEIDLPALAIVGENDGLTPVAFHEYLAAELPTCDLTVLENAAHLAMVERPEAFTDAVGSFVDNLR